MPGYEVIGVDDTFGDPWYAEDALHCRTMGIFDPDMIHISHKYIRDEELINNGAIHIEAEIIDYNDFDAILDVAVPTATIKLFSLFNTFKSCLNPSNAIPSTFKRLDISTFLLNEASPFTFN